MLDLSPAESTVKRYVSSGSAFTTQRHGGHTQLPEIPEMRVNKPGEPSLTPCVAAYSADWWENKAGSSMINTSPFLRMLRHGRVWRFDPSTSLSVYN